MKQFSYKKFYLRKPTLVDAETILAITNDKDVMEFYGESGAWLKNSDEAMSEINWGLSLFEENAGRWVIASESNDKYVGDIGFFSFDPANKKAEIGFKLDKAYWGQGITSQFTAQLLEYAFEELGYNRIEALVDPRNVGSSKVLLKNGFIKEGTLRDYEFEHGAFVDLDMYSILQRDFIKKDNG